MVYRTPTRACVACTSPRHSYIFICGCISEREVETHTDARESRFRNMLNPVVQTIMPRTRSSIVCTFSGWRELSESQIHPCYAQVARCFCMIAQTHDLTYQTRAKVASICRCLKNISRSLLFVFFSCDLLNEETPRTLPVIQYYYVMVFSSAVKGRRSRYYILHRSSD